MHIRASASQLIKRNQPLRISDQTIRVNSSGGSSVKKRYENY